MSVKSYFLAASLCCMLPFMAQGVDLDDSKPEPGPRAALRSRSITPIIIETESGMLTIQFRSNLGEVNVCLQKVTGEVEYSQLVDTSIQNQAVVMVPSGTYVLTIFGTVGNIIHQESIFIP